MEDAALEAAPRTITEPCSDWVTAVLQSLRIAASVSSKEEVW